MIKSQHRVLRALRMMLCAMLFNLLTTGCFTGVESTPKIGASEVKHKSATVTEEQTYLDDISSVSFDRWEPGKRFIVSDRKISMIFNPTPFTSDINIGDTLIYIKSEEVVSPVGTAVEITLNKINSTTPLVYRQNGTLDELKQRTQVVIPFTVDIDLVEKVRNKLIGNTYYLVTPRWLDDKNNFITRYKFIQAKIIDVQPGTSEFPVRIVFIPEYSKLQPDQVYSLYMTVGNASASTRNFDTLFSLTNPRNKYSHITDENWNAIIENRVLPGMTREEARLSLGNPIDVDKGHDYSSVYEKWVYDGGIYLIFRDGILESYRR